MLSNELTEVTLVSVNVRLFEKKSATKSYISPYFLHTLSMMIVSRSILPRIACSMLIRDSMLSFCPIELRR